MRTGLKGYQQEDLEEQQEKDNSPVWQPFPGKPQVWADHRPVDELFDGGAGGAGKSDLLLGLAGTAHKRALILRREFPRLRALIERSREIYNRIGSTRDKDSFNESLHLWRLTDDRTIQFGAVQYEKDWMKYQGQPHDLKGFDEITEFTETQFRSINIWNRSADINQPCRVVCTGNPPTDADGEWVIVYWAPWLDPDYPDRAEPGDLVWFVRIKGVGDEPDKDLEIGRTSKAEVYNYLARGEKIPRPSIEVNGCIVTGKQRLLS